MHRLLVGNHLDKIVVGVAVVCHSTGYKHAPVEVLYYFAVEVNILSHRILTFRNAERSYALLYLFEHRHRSTRLDITVDLSTHFSGKELVHLPDLYLIAENTFYCHIRFVLTFNMFLSANLLTKNVFPKNI